ncbi:hypothetical protein [Polymorphobacter megasporae]|uniref:hypothetical protein n=1 Tax=Glacieibacterium megasporae TaxID=2835787 RepID=UPI001C1E4A91|nr:hypothetical protein [Polymorphobacter megasporae]UAJ12502.1 hypothetical protein KTC28_22135 [Polymorphobacter megasporae]
MAVGVGGHHDATDTGAFGGPVHDVPTRAASVCAINGQGNLFDFDPRPSGRKCARHDRRIVGAVVGTDDDRHRRRHLLSRTIEGGQAGDDMGDLVAGRNTHGNGTCRPDS